MKTKYYICIVFENKGKYKDMAKLQNKTKDNPKLEQRLLKDGRISLYLEYYLGRTETPVLDEYGNPVIYTSGAMKGKPKYKVTHNRKKETLPFYLIAKPSNPFEKKQNNEILDIAKKIRFEREQQLKENQHGIRLKREKDINFLDWMWSYYEAYTKADKRHIKRAYNVFIDFLTATPEYSKYAKRIKPEQLTKQMIVAFTEYLQSRFKGEGAHTLYARFKKVLKNAVEADVLRKNPTTGISIKIDNGALKKEVLSLDEIKQLITTHYIGENPDIRRAFIFCLYCGLRWCDVKELTFANVDYSNRLLKFEQAKTKGHSTASSVIIPLNEGLLNLIGEPSQEGNRDKVIFPLPSHNMCLKALRHWVKRAGIQKHITWHCARHSFAVNILNNGANIKTVASLLGHSGLKHTEKYTRAVDSLKQEAINSLPELNL